MTTFWRSDLTPLSDFQLLAAVAHRDAAALVSPLLHGEAAARRRESACRQCIDGDQGEQHVVAAETPGSDVGAGSLVPCCCKYER